MAGKGGRRPGAGRKPNAVRRLIHATPIQLAEAKIAEKLPWLVDKLMELAEGVSLEKLTRDGTTALVYQQSPDRQAIEYLIDRVLGKPIDRTEQGNPGEFKQGYVIRLIRADEGDDDGTATAS